MSNRMFPTFFAVFFRCFAPGLLLAQAQSSQPVNDLTKEIVILKKGQAQIRSQVAEIKRLLQNRSTAAPFEEFVLDLEGRPFKGNRTAKLTLVEFLDFQ